MTLTSSEVDILFQALDALERQMAEAGFLGSLFEAMLGDKTDETTRLTLKFEQEERARLQQEKVSQFKRQSAVLRAKLVELEATKG